MHIWTYNNKSESAIALSDKLDVWLIKHENSQFRGGPNKVVLNWGSTHPSQEVMACQVINKPFAVANAVNKITSLELFDAAKVPTVKWTRNKEWAKAWAALGHKIVCRRKVEGKDGEGIVLAEYVAEVVDAKLYTKLEEHAHEYRVTVFRDTVICVQKKVRIPGLPAYNDDIRTTAGGYGFNVVAGAAGGPGTEDACIKAVKALGLDFGGVDVLWDHRLGTCVLEVNTAPQLTPYACDKLAQAIKKAYPGEFK